jgi:hypothetical protein
VRNVEPSLHPSTRLIPSRKRIALVAHDKQMNESNYLSGEFTDEFLHEQADAGDYFLDLNSGHLDNDSGNRNKKRRVSKVLSIN